MIEFVNLKRVENKINEFLVYVVHLNNEVRLVNLISLFVSLSLEYATDFQLLQMFAHIFRPEAEVVDDLLRNYVLRVNVIILLIDEVNLIHEFFLTL